MKSYSPEVCDNCAYNLKREISIANDLIVKLDARSCQNAIFKTCAVKYIIKKYEELKNSPMDTHVIWENEDKTMCVYESDGKFSIAYSNSSLENPEKFLDSLNFLRGFEAGYKTALIGKKS